MFPADAFAPARILRRLCVSIAAAISTAMEPAAEASVPWLQTAGKLLSALSGWLATASDTVLHKIPAAAIRVAQSIVGAWKPWLATALEFLTADLGPLVKARAADMGRLLAAALERARHVRRVLAASPSMAAGARRRRCPLPRRREYGRRPAAPHHEGPRPRRRAYPSPPVRGQPEDLLRHRPRRASSASRCHGGAEAGAPRRRRCRGVSSCELAALLMAPVSYDHLKVPSFYGTLG
ncbi:hypothetical protein ACP70R_023542 [Stipagrostis hirtigluma subsp. patula]